jgi:hypothetical protein
MKRIVILAILAMALAHTIYGQQQTNAATMKQFSLLIRVPVTYSPDEVKAAGVVWDQLLENWKANGTYVISFAFPGDSYVIQGTAKEIKHESVIANNLRVVSNLVIQAANIQDACSLAKEVPILKYGGSVEVRELPKPLTLN